MNLPPLRRRLPVVVGIAIGAPVCAEYLSAYLTATGDAAELIGGLIIFVPLYGCPALLIREISVRRGIGWTGRLLLAAAFGVLMPGVIDLSMFAAHSPEVASWEAMREPTLVPALGISAYTALSWSLGHVLMSIGAPLALADALGPRLRGRPLLGRIGIPVAVLFWVVSAVFVHLDQRHVFGFELRPTQVMIMAATTVALVAVGLSPLGRPISRPPAADRGWIGGLMAGVFGMLAFDFVPLTWLGVALLLTGVVLAVMTLTWWSRHRGLSARTIGAMAAGAVIARTITGFLAPLPQGVVASAKYAQNSVFLVAALAIAAAVVLLHPRADDPPR